MKTDKRDQRIEEPIDFSNPEELMPTPKRLRQSKTQEIEETPAKNQKVYKVEPNFVSTKVNLYRR